MLEINNLRKNFNNRTHALKGVSFKVKKKEFVTMLGPSGSGKTTLFRSVNGLETIDSGELARRMFEVLATLQKSMLDIIKSQTMYLMPAEEGTKRIARDIDIYTDKSNKKLTTGQTQSGNVVRGTKDLMRGIQDDINPEQIEDIEPED